MIVALDLLRNLHTAGMLTDQLTDLLALYLITLPSTPHHPPPPPTIEEIRAVRDLKEML